MSGILNARRLLNDPTEVRWSDEVLGGYNSDGLKRAYQLAPWKFLSGETFVAYGSQPAESDVSDACLGYYIAARALMEEADDPNNATLAQNFFQMFEAHL